MRKKHSFLVSAMALTLTIVLSFSAVHFSFVSYADEGELPAGQVTPTKAEELPGKETPKQEEPPKDQTPIQADPPKDSPDTSSATSASTPAESSSSKQDESSTKTSITFPNPFSSSTSSTDASTSSTNANTSEKDVQQDASEKSSEKEASSKDSSNSTTKSGGGNKSTTKNTKYTTRYYAPAPATTVRKMTVPHVDNTEISGSTLSPMDAYFERISGDTSTEPFTIYVEETELATTETEKRNLSTTAIVAICLVAIGVVVCLLTLLFALRNKRSAGDRVVEYDDEYEDVDVGASSAQGNSYNSGEADLNSATQVDQSSQFTVVSLDDKDYKD